MLRNGVNQGTNGLHDAEELLIWQIIQGNKTSMINDE